MQILTAAIASPSLMVLACTKANKTAATPRSNAVRLAVHARRQTAIVVCAGRLSTTRHGSRGDQNEPTHGNGHIACSARFGVRTHIAIQEEVGGKNVEWMERVSDEQYSGK
jgi:hypothetical protein